MLVKFTTLRGGCYIEVGVDMEYNQGTRCFRFDSEGNAEYALYQDLLSDNPSPRWYGHVFKERDFTIA